MSGSTRLSLPPVLMASNAVTRSANWSEIMSDVPRSMCVNSSSGRWGARNAADRREQEHGGALEAPLVAVDGVAMAAVGLPQHRRERVADHQHDERDDVEHPVAGGHHEEQIQPERKVDLAVRLPLDVEETREQSPPARPREDARDDPGQYEKRPVAPEHPGERRGGEAERDVQRRPRPLDRRLVAPLPERGPPAHPRESQPEQRVAQHLAAPAPARDDRDHGPTSSTCSRL